MELKVETNVEVTLKMSSDDFREMLLYVKSAAHNVPLSESDKVRAGVMVDKMIHLHDSEHDLGYRL